MQYFLHFLKVLLAFIAIIGLALFGMQFAGMGVIG